MRHKTTAALIASELVPFGQGETLHTPPEKANLQQIVTMFAMINTLEKALEKRKEQMRELLLAQAKALGDEGEKGSFTLRVGNETVVAEFRQNKDLDTEALRALMSTHNVPVLDVFDEVKSLVLNPSKLEYVIDIGKLDKKQVEGLRKASFALKVQPGEELKTALTEAVSSPNGDGPPDKKRVRK